MLTIALRSWGTSGVVESEGGKAVMAGGWEGGGPGLWESRKEASSGVRVLVGERGRSMEVGCALRDLLGGFGERKSRAMAASVLSPGWHGTGTYSCRLYPGLMLPPLMGICTDEARDLETENLKKITNPLTFQEQGTTLL